MSATKLSETELSESDQPSLPKVILIFLAVDWPIFMRRPMLYALAEKSKKHGTTVIAINRPLCPFTTPLRKPKRIPELFRAPHLEQLSENFFLYSPRYFLHDHLAPKIPGAQRMNLWALKSGIAKMLHKLGIQEDFPVLWYYYPQQGYVSSLYTKNVVVYDLYDYPGDLNGIISDEYESLRVNNTQSVDLLLTASKALQNKYASDYGNSLMTGNGLEKRAYELLRDDSIATHNAVLDKPQPRIRYAGMISERLNWNLLLKVAEARPQWSFVFAGHLANPSFLEYFEQTPNLHYIGEVDQRDVPSVVRGFDVGIMPYFETVFFQFLNPLKFYEFSAAGVPMVSSSIDELRPYPTELVIVAEPTVESWVSSIEAQLARDKNAVKLLGHNVAAAHLWSDIAENILGRLMTCSSAK